MQCPKCTKQRIPFNTQSALITLVDKTYTIKCAKCGKHVGRTNHVDDIDIKVASESVVQL